MTERTQKSNSQKELSKGRVIVGAFILIAGFFSPLLIPLVLSSNLGTGFKTTLSGLLAFGIPEVAMIIAVGIMGKSGLNYLKSKALKFLERYGPPDHVSPVRYKIGLGMFILPLLLGFLYPYIQTHLEFISENIVAISMVLDALLIASIFVLGGHFWDKLMGLFVQRATINFNKD